MGKHVWTQVHAFEASPFHSSAAASPFAEGPDSHSYFDVRHDLSDPGEKRRRFGRPNPGSTSPRLLLSRCSSAPRRAPPPAREAAPRPAVLWGTWGGGRERPARLARAEEMGRGALGCLRHRLSSASAPLGWATKWPVSSAETEEETPGRFSPERNVCILGLLIS